MKMRKIYTVTLAVAAGAAAATMAGVMVASAATPTASPTWRHGAHHRVFGLPKLVGEVTTADTSGTLVVTPPDGTAVTLTVTANTKTWKYQGPGEKPVSERVTSIPKGELVEVIGTRASTKGGQPTARLIVDLGFQLSS
jgi:uncharacterized protein YgiM (DUF1202 family)